MLAARAQSLLNQWARNEGYAYAVTEGKGWLEEAESAILAALNQGQREDSWRHFAILGQIWTAQNRVHQAMEAFRHVVLSAPQDGRAHWFLGQFLLKVGNLEEADVELRAAIRLYSAISDFQASLGELQLRNNNLQDAQSSLRRAIRLDPRNPHPRILLGELLAKKGKYRRAARSVTRALALVPTSHKALMTLASLLEAQGQTDKAVACLKRILARDPKNAEIAIRISNQYMRAGRLDEAEQTLRHALALQPVSAIYQHLSEVLAAQSRTADGIAAMTEACRLEPENQKYRVKLSELIESGAAGVPGPPMIGQLTATQEVLPNSRLAKSIGLLWHALRGKR